MTYERFKELVIPETIARFIYPKIVILKMDIKDLIKAFKEYDEGKIANPFVKQRISVTVDPIKFAEFKAKCEKEGVSISAKINSLLD